MKKRITAITLAAAALCLLIILGLKENNLIQALPQKCYTVNLDGQAWFSVSDRSGLESLLEDYKNNYVEKVPKLAEIKAVSFKQKLEIIEDTKPADQIIDLKEAKEKINSTKNEASYIQVDSGDTMWALAHEHNLTVEELQALNPEFNPDKIKPGDKLVVSPRKQVLDVLVTYEITAVKEIPFTTEYIKDSSMYQSQRKLETQGVPGQKRVTYENTCLNGGLLEQKVLSTKVLKEPVTAQVRVGTKKAVSRSGSNFGVVRGGRLSSSFGYRIHPVTGVNTFHEGIDIAAPTGTRVYAYSSGTITYAGWVSGYGKFIEITHGNGLRTHYGHLSAIYVKRGQSVSTGQVIGAVGSTGVSTGSHLHFEVLVNGNYKNPLNYL